MSGMKPPDTTASLQPRPRRHWHSSSAPSFSSSSALTAAIALTGRPAKQATRCRWPGTAPGIAAVSVPLLTAAPAVQQQRTCRSDSLKSHLPSMARCVMACAPVHATAERDRSRRPAGAARWHPRTGDAAHLDLLELAGHPRQLVDALLPDQRRVHVKDDKALHAARQRLVLQVQIHAVHLRQRGQVLPQHRQVEARRDRDLSKQAAGPPARPVSGRGARQTLLRWVAREP